jgi:hypothetical protein
VRERFLVQNLFDYFRHKPAMSRRGVKLCQQLLATSRNALTQQQFNQITSNVAVRHMSSASVNSKDGKVLHPDLLNENLKKTQYAVRGELYMKAEELRSKGKEIIFTNGKLGWPAIAAAGDIVTCDLLLVLSCSGKPSPAWSKAIDIYPAGEIGNGSSCKPNFTPHYLV